MRSFLLIGVALTFTAATITASVFSSFIVQGGVIDVLVDSPFCGGFPNSSNVFRSRVQFFAPSLSDSCYPKVNSTPHGTVFMQPWIPLTAEKAPCPLNDTEWCDTKDALSLDTGLLDLGKTFGFNLAAKDRIQSRRKTKCSVLPVEGLYDVMNVSDHPGLAPTIRSTLPGEQVVALYYGPTFSEAWPEATVILSLLMSNATTEPRTSESVLYTYESDRC